MESKAAIALGIYFAAGPLLLLPVFLYMLDKINRFRSSKHPFSFYLVWWYTIPMTYRAVQRENPRECSMVPLRILGLLVIGIFVAYGAAWMMKTR